VLQAQVFLASEKARNQKQDQKQAQQEEFMDVEEGNSNGITIKEGKIKEYGYLRIHWMKAMHITFICQEKDIVILIESGGINSFIDVQVIKEINASIEKTTMLAVMKCNNFPNSYSLCKGKSLVGYTFF
jgi:hypothetical protein